MNMRKTFLILAAAIAAGSNVYAEKVKLEQTPMAVQQAIRSRAGRHMIEDIDRDTRNGQVTYEASWKAGTAQQELLVSDQGKILRDVAGPKTAVAPPPSLTVTNGTNLRYAGLAPSNVTLSSGAKVDVAAAPKPVQDAINLSLAGARLEDLERGQWNGRTVYEAAFKRNGQHTELQILEDGSILTAAPTSTAAATAQASSNALNNPSQLRYAGLASTNVQVGSESKIEFNAAPLVVRNTINTFAGNVPIEDLERGQWNGRTVYEAAFKKNGQHIELQVLEDGSILTQPPAGAAKAVGAPAAGTVGTGTQPR